MPENKLPEHEQAEHELPEHEQPEHEQPEEFVAVVDEPDGSIAEIVYEADPVLLAAVDQARAALAEITPAATIGEVVGHAVEGEHVLSLFFASKLPGYPDWHWTATLARVSESDEPSVLEVEMLPGESSVLSPAWVPWADRLTPDALIDDSENEFDDDDVDDDLDDEEASVEGDEDEHGAGAEGSGEPGGAYDAGSHDDFADGPDDDGFDDSDDDDDDADAADEAEAREAARVIGYRRDRDGIDIDTVALSVDPDAGAAFDATDDFADAGDIEDLEGQEHSD